jgi:hypothetical protein
MITVSQGQGNILPFIEEIDPRIITNTSRRQQVQDAIANGTCYLAIIKEEIKGYAIFDYRLFGYGFLSELFVPEDSDFRAEVFTELINYLSTINLSPVIYGAANESDSNRIQLLMSLGFKTSGILYTKEGAPLLFFCRDNC